MNTTAVTTAAAPTVPVYASYGSRVWASTLDAIFNFLLLIPVVIAIGLIRSDLANYAGLVLSLAYFTLGHGGASGQTWGKKLAGIRVIHESGAALGYVRALIRWAVAIGLTILLVLPNLIDVLWPLWDSKRQALRDKAVGSIVIRA
jgi:uncharacterized RDD family membrane protein YckC